MSRPTMLVEKIYHKNENRIFIFFEYNQTTINIIKKSKLFKWSQTKKAWYGGCNGEVYKYIKDTFQSNYNIKTKENNIISENRPVQAEEISIKKMANDDSTSLIRLAINKYARYLENKRYSPNTIKSYIMHIQKFIHNIGENKIQNVDNDDINNYIHMAIIKGKYSASYQNQLINAIKQFYYVNYNQKVALNKLERPKFSKKLPSVLSKQEVLLLLDGIANIKHKTILSLIYSGGLRISEAVNIELKDIDSDRMLINIRGGKGKKDRNIVLAERILHMLTEYYKAYKPSKYIFEGEGGGQYSARSIQAVFQKAKKKAGITKNASVHTLRHSYATHLHEAGTDIRFIQELLGHKSSKTTEIYTHVSKRSIQNIKSPFDEL